MKIKHIALILLLLLTVQITTATFKVSDEPGTKTITVMEQLIYCNSTYYIKDMNSDYYKVPTLSVLNKLKPFTTHLVQLSEEFYEIKGVIT